MPEKKPRFTTDELPHAGQIITNRRTIIRFLWDIELSVTDNTIWLISNGVNNSDDKLRLYATCARLYYLSRLVYKGKDGIRKLDAARYRKELFEGFAETKDEVKHVMMERRKQGGNTVCVISNEAVERTYRRFNCIAELWCNNIACLYEQIYIPEMAYEFDYVLKHDGMLPKPEYSSEYSLFPKNYKDLDYTDGIAAYFDDVMDYIF